MLIIVMMLAPLRVVFAVPCNMQEMYAMQLMPASSGHIMMHHNMTAAGHDMSAMLQTPAMQQQLDQHDCCTDLNTGCSGDCDLGMSVSVILQDAPYATVYLSSIEPLTLILRVLSRELTPPSRPPATLHS